MAKKPNFAERFCNGANDMCATGKSPKSWKNFDSLMLLKDPANYQEGEETILKNFRPIALSNVSYKTFTTMLSNRITEWLKINQGVQWSQRAIFNRWRQG